MSDNTYQTHGAFMTYMEMCVSCAQIGRQTTLLEIKLIRWGDLHLGHILSNGGSWEISGSFMRSAHRNYNNNENHRDDGIGFRLALKPIQNSAPLDLNSTAL